MEITEKFPDEVVQIASGGYHTLALTANNECYGFGKQSKGQMGMPWKRGTQKGTADPVRVPIGGSEADKPELSKVYAGSLFAMMEIADN